ncbi:MAG: hypothetical protein K0Q73_7001 [Paenibacillus sp.]|jgi:AraC-like DNA-binding protein|nr:hypothetical protein [Paenibacillus sp.]
MKKRFLRKLVAAYIMVAFLYTFIAGGVFLYKSNEIMEVQLQNQRKVFAEQTKTRLDMKLNIAFNYVNQLRVKQDVSQYALDPTTDHYAMTQVFNELNGNMNAFTSVGYQIDMTTPDTNMVITPYRTMSRVEYYNYMGFDPDTIRQLQEYESTGLWSKVQLVARSIGNIPEARQLITFARRESLSNGSEIMLFISFHEKDFMPVLNADNLEDFGILFDEVWIDGDFHVDRPTGSAILTAAVDSSGYSKFELDERVLHVMQSSILDNIRYVYFTPPNALSRNLWLLIRDASLVFAVMAFLGIGLALLLANRMYKPVRKMISIFKDYSDLKAVDEFSFIQETASQIQVTNDSLRETIKNNRMSLKSKFLRDLLFGWLPQDQIQQGLAKYELGWLELESSVILFDFPEEKNWEYEYSPEAILNIKSQTMQIIRKHLEENTYCESVELDHARYAMMIPEIRLSHIKRIVVGAVASVEDSFGIHIAAAVGKPAEYAAGLKESYQSAGRLMEQRFALNRQSVLVYKDLSNLQSLSYYYPLDMERELIICVLQGKAERVEELLNHILDENLNERKLNEGTLQFFLYAFITTINRILQQMNKIEADVFAEGKSVYDTLWSGRSEEQLRERLHTLIQHIMMNARQKKLEMDQSNVHLMIDFIHMHYQEDLGLTDMAKHFNLSPNYISYLIKDHIGDNFKEYLNEYRVKQAKRLMNENPTIKINDLAGRVGCNNVNTFIRIFKRYEGVSPGQYMKQ